MTHPCDVVEDILRIYGYNNIEIPSSLNSSLIIKGEDDRSNKLQNLVAEQLVGAGFNEILNNSLTKKDYYTDLKLYGADHCVALMNPLSEDLNVMRQTLLFGGLESLKRNINYKNPNLRMFEFGNCYAFDASKRNQDNPLSAYSEEMHMGIWLTGKSVAGSWAHPDEDSSYYQLKAHVENIFTRLGLNPGLVKADAESDEVFTQALVMRNREDKLLCRMGVVNTVQTSKFGIVSPVYFAELNWTNLMRATRKNHIVFKEISKYPSVSRDLALLVDAEVTFLQIEAVAYASERKLLKKVELFDVYEGSKLPAGKKSYAVNFILQDEAHTLNDKQIEKVMQNLVKNLQSKLGATLR